MSSSGSDRRTAYAVNNLGFELKTKIPHTSVALMQSRGRYHKQFGVFDGRVLVGWPTGSKLNGGIYMPSTQTAMMCL